MSASKKGNSSQKKSKLRKSSAVFHQIKWSTNLNESEFSIVYLDRFVGMMEQPLTDWNMDSTDTTSIPWHRVYKIKHNGRVVWDRDERFDLLSDVNAYLKEISGATDQTTTDDDKKEKEKDKKIQQQLNNKQTSSSSSAKHSPSSAKGSPSSAKHSPSKKSTSSQPKQKFIQPYWEKLTSYHFKRGDWVSTSSSSSSSSSTSTSKSGLKIVTLNVLFDTYQKDQIYSEHRYPLIFRLLNNTNADVIGLQEVRRPFLKQLLAQRWVQKHYYVSDDESGATFNKFGQVILSKLPFNEVEVFHFTPHKNIVIAKDLLFQDKCFSACCIHLTSDRSKEHEKKRAQQLQRIFAQSTPSTTAPGASSTHAATQSKNSMIVLGDFNFGDDDDDQNQLIPSHYEDAWCAFIAANNETLDTAPGYTFDPKTNTMADITSLTKQPRRMDRILYDRSQFKCAFTEMIGQTSVDILVLDDQDMEMDVSIHPSDHYGIFTELN